jgi:hypothetical protein
MFKKTFYEFKKLFNNQIQNFKKSDFNKNYLDYCLLNFDFFSEIINYWLKIFLFLINKNKNKNQKFFDKDKILYFIFLTNNVILCQHEKEEEKCNFYLFKNFLNDNLLISNKLNFYQIRFHQDSFFFQKKMKKVIFFLKKEVNFFFKKEVIFLLNLSKNLFSYFFSFLISKNQKNKNLLPFIGFILIILFLIKKNNKLLKSNFYLKSNNFFFFLNLNKFYIDLMKKIIPNYFNEFIKLTSFNF